MALDRQSIEKQFSLGSHGYDPQAVDAHLSRLADEIAEFKSAARRRSETLASSASEQVRAIIDAAETSAAEMQRLAEAEAEEIREDARHEARTTREAASEDVREHVSRVSEATAGMLGRLDGMESELSGLIESLRSGATRLDSDLHELEADLGRVQETSRPASRAQFQPDAELDPGLGTPEDGWGSSAGTESWESSSGAEEAAAGGATESWDAGPASSGWGAPEHPADSAPAEVAPAEVAPADSVPADSWEAPPPGEVDAPSEPVAEAGTSIAQEPGSFPDHASAPPGEAIPAPYGERSGEAPPEAGGEPYDQPEAGSTQEADDSEGARLIALNMALNGSPREETARYLSENFQLPDREGLLDEVYASVES